MMNTTSRILCASTLMIILCSCATPRQLYEGPLKPPTEEAILVGQPRAILKLQSEVYIREVDGLDLDNFWCGCPTMVHLLAGAHTVVLQVVAANAAVEVQFLNKLQFTAESGSQYIAKHTTWNREQVFWIENRTTGAVVAGNKPTKP